MCLMSHDVRTHREKKAAQQTFFRPPQPSIKDLALQGKLFKGNMPTQDAQRLFRDKAKAKAFLQECNGDSDEARDLRCLVTEQGLDLDELREWLEAKN